MEVWDKIVEVLRKGARGVLDFFKRVFQRLRQWIKSAPYKKLWLTNRYFSFGEDAATLINQMRLRLLPDDKYFNILCHGNPKRVIMNGRVLKPAELAEMLLEKGFEPGTPIRLICCWTGKKDTGFAYRLSQIMGSEVIAPTKRIQVFPDGSGFKHAPVYRS